jgi:hypothetical protein
MADSWTPSGAGSLFIRMFDGLLCEPRPSIRVMRMVLLMAACAGTMLASMCVASAVELRTVPQVLQNGSWCRKTICITFGPNDILWYSRCHSWQGVCVGEPDAKGIPCPIFRIDDKLPPQERQRLERLYHGWVNTPRPRHTYRIQSKCADGKISDEIFLLLSSEWMFVSGKTDNEDYSDYQGYTRDRDRQP